MIIDTNECWLYAGVTSDKGYGRIWLDGKYQYVHRLMWADANSRVIPEGYQVDHLCRVPRCINPAHLEPVTPRENNLRGITMAAFYARRDSCKYGHKFTKENTRMQGNTRRCRTCCREYMRGYLRSHPKGAL